MTAPFHLGDLLLNAQNQRVRPIFIIGAPRSATSAMVWALGQHRNIQPMPETAWIASLATGSYLSYLKGSERGRFSHLSNVDYPMQPFLLRMGEAADRVVRDVFELRCERFYGDYRASGQICTNPNSENANLQLLRSIDDPKQRWIDGTPLNSQYVWILSEMFPEARFLHNLRRPDEVVTSLEGFATVGADPQPLEEGIRTWIEHTENAWYAEQAFGAERAHRVDFQRIAQEPENLLREVLSFLGEEFDPACVLPLKRRLNSSEVDDRRASNLAKLRELTVYQTAEALYEHVRASHVPAHADAHARGVIKQRFLDYCYDRSII